jgi:NAD(P)-dependent dehydrogenase (short-subunit alcohol dehydrogenase family)
MRLEGKKTIVTGANRSMLTQTMALELAKHGIRVNAIAPGYTPYEESFEFDSAIKDIPLGRVGLASDQASTRY